MVERKHLLFSEETTDDMIKGLIKRHQSQALKLCQISTSAIPFLAAALRGVPAIESAKLALLASIAELDKVIILRNELIL